MTAEYACPHPPINEINERTFSVVGVDGGVDVYLPDMSSIST